jgi:hypothetical protein
MLLGSLVDGFLRLLLCVFAANTFITYTVYTVYIGIVIN